jgi:hypothetical protein
MQAPVLNTTDYRDILVETLSSAYVLLGTLAKYPGSPSTSNVRQLITNAQRCARQDDFIGARAQLGRLLLESNHVFNYDAGDAVTRGLMKNCQQLVRIAHQNIIDNALKARAKRTPKLVECTAAPCSIPSTSFVDRNGREKYRFFVQQSEATVNPIGQERRTWRKDGARSKSRDRNSTRPKIHTSPMKFKSSQNLATNYPNLKLGQNSKDEQDAGKILDEINNLNFEDFDEWTSKDEEQFDAETYYGSSTWFLE